MWPSVFKSVLLLNFLTIDYQSVVHVYDCRFCALNPLLNSRVVPQVLELPYDPPTQYIDNLTEKHTFTRKILIVLCNPYVHKLMNNDGMEYLFNGLTKMKIGIKN